MEYSHFLQQKYPGIQCTNAVKQASDRNLMLAQMVSYAQVAGFATAFFGSAIFNAMSMPVPVWATWVEQNRGFAIAGFFLSNTVVSSLVQVYPRSAIHSPPPPKAGSKLVAVPLFVTHARRVDLAERATPVRAVPPHDEHAHPADRGVRGVPRRRAAPLEAGHGGAPGDQRLVADDLRAQPLAQRRRA